MTYDAKPLERALRRLESEQGPRARRNARAAVKAELRRLESTVDRNYPPPPRRRKGGKRKTPAQRELTLLQSGWVAVSHTATVAGLHQAGAAIKTLVLPRSAASTHSAGGPDGVVTRTYARQWAVWIWRERGVRILKDAVRSPKRRDEILGELKLAGKIS